MKKNVTLHKMLLKVAIVFQAVLIAAVVIIVTIFGLVNQQKQNAYEDILLAASDKALQLTNNINSISKRAASIGDAINKETNILLNQQNRTAKDIDNRELADDIIMQKSSSLLEYLNSSSDISGVFLMLRSNEAANIADEIPCLYIRKNMETDTVELKFGDIEIAKELGISYSNVQGNVFKAPPDTGASVLTFLNAHFKNSEADLLHVDSVYISEPIALYGDDHNVMLQTFPLLDDNGNCYGVFGIEISMLLLSKAIESVSLPKMSGGFYGITDNQKGSFLSVHASSNDFANAFIDQKHLVRTVLKQNIAFGDDVSTVFSFRNTTSLGNSVAPNQEMVAAYSVLNLYSKKSPYSNGSYVLYAFSPKSLLFNEVYRLQYAIVLCSIIVVLLNITMVMYITRIIKRPVDDLCVSIKNNDPEEALKLKKYEISEIDSLSSQLQGYSNKIMHSASRLSSIINLFEKSIGGFEEDLKENKVYLTDSLLKIFGIKDSKKNFMTFEEWTNLKDSFFTERISETDDIYKCSDEPERYYQFNFRNEKNITYGVVIDVTKDVLEKKRLEFERDFDGLTRLLNRVAFSKVTSMVVKKQPGKVGAMIFSDLDNLKYINDNYGHDSGDEYIKAMANGLSKFKQHKGIVSRVSGDEFSVFIYGYDTQEEIRKICNQILVENRSLRIVLPDGSYHNLQCSTGISWYPNDSADLGLLVKYADFAMYEVKHTNKGEVKEFDLQAYNRKVFLTSKIDILNAFIENELVYFAFQPIVDVKTGRIFAYEAFMRSKHRDLTSALQILELTKAQSKLYKLEKLVLSNMFAFVSNFSEAFLNYPLFFNSTASIELTEDDFKQFINDFGDYVFTRMIAEVSDTEEIDTALRKAEKFRDVGMQIAIDSCGAEGAKLCSDAKLATLNPEFIKIGLNTVRDIDTDENKYMCVKQMIEDARIVNAKVVAEGVETEAELRTLIGLGVDYCQGYLLYRPTPYLLADSQDVIDIVENIVKQ